MLHSGSVAKTKEQHVDEARKHISADKGPKNGKKKKRKESVKLKKWHKILLFKSQEGSKGHKEGTL